MTEWKEKAVKALTFTLITIVLRLFLQWIPGRAPVLPMALYTGMLYGTEGAYFVAAASLLASDYIIGYGGYGNFDSFSITTTILAIALVEASLLVTIKILKIGKKGKFEPSALFWRVCLATVFVEIGLCLMRGLLITTGSVMHLIANIIFVGLIIVLAAPGKKENKK